VSARAVTLGSAYDGARLSATDFGGKGPAVLLLHGLAGHGGEWSETASWLCRTHRVIAPDARGHGVSERMHRDDSRAAHVADAAQWLEEVGGRATVVGHSLGGHTAFLVASERPDLVQCLVVAEASPQAHPESVAQVGAWLARWAERFASRKGELAFFGGGSARAGAWASEGRP